MKTTLRPNRISVDLQEYKQPWLDYCKARGITPSAAFRQIVAKLTNGNDAMERPVTHAVARKKVRVELRLTKAEIATVSEMARREGFSATRWIVALINARVYATPQLGQRELETLARSNLQMLAIGRNLNQLARAANAGVSNWSKRRKVAFEMIDISHPQTWHCSAISRPHEAEPEAIRSAPARLTNDSVP
jgi:predicted DNA binding CopG/RHH family protein